MSSLVMRYAMKAAVAEAMAMASDEQPTAKGAARRVRLARGEGVGVDMR